MAHVEREIALVKVAGTGDKRIEALRMADVFRAKVVDTTLTSFIFEITGSSDKVDRFIALMRECGLVEVGRPGVGAIARGPEALQGLRIGFQSPAPRHRTGVPLSTRTDRDPGSRHGSQ